MSVQATSHRHPFEQLFAELTGRMGVVHELGPVPNGVAGQPGRVVWTDLGPGATEKIGYSIPHTVTIGRQPIEYAVEIYGGSPLEVYQLARDLEGWLDNLVGPPQGAPPPAGNGYKVGRPSVPMAVGDGTATGCSSTMTVTLYLPIFSEIRPLLTVTRPSVTTTAAAGQGAINPGSIEWQG